MHVVLQNILQRGISSLEELNFEKISLHRVNLTLKIAYEPKYVFLSPGKTKKIKHFLYRLELTKFVLIMMTYDSLSYLQRIFHFKLWCGWFGNLCTVYNGS